MFECVHVCFCYSHAEETGKRKEVRKFHFKQFSSKTEGIFSPTASAEKVVNFSPFKKKKKSPLVVSLLSIMDLSNPRPSALYHAHLSCPCCVSARSFLPPANWGIHINTPHAKIAKPFACCSTTSADNT